MPGSPRPTRCWPGSAASAGTTSRCSSSPAESATSEAMQTDLTVTAPGADTVIMSGDPTTGDRDGGRAQDLARHDADRPGRQRRGRAVLGLRHRGRAGASCGWARTRRPSATCWCPSSSGRSPSCRPGSGRSRSIAVGGPAAGRAAAASSTRARSRCSTARGWSPCTRPRTSGSTRWSAIRRRCTRGSTRRSPPTPNSSSTTIRRRPTALTEPGQVDRPTASYGSDEAGYYCVTYDKGAAALHAARAAAGAAAFDAAIRCYVERQRLADRQPADLAAALAGCRRRSTVLRQGAGAAVVIASETSQANRRSDG